MARKKTHTPEEIVAKLRQVEVLVGQGKTVAEAVRSIGVTEPTYYRWRTEFGGLKLVSRSAPSAKSGLPPEKWSSLMYGF